MRPDSTLCYLVDKSTDGSLCGAIKRRGLEELPPGEVLVRVRYSSLNYKDALAATGNRAVARHLPHVPGIDAAGVVVESESTDWPAGTEVIVTSYEMGAGRWGGWSQYARVPADWLVRRPEQLTPHQAMSLGTAGLTAALSVEALIRHDVTPDSGPVVVTGATGGVGGLAVMLLGQLGYEVTAITGKRSMAGALRTWGARDVLGREELTDTSGGPLRAARWAGGVDTVGGVMLANLLRAAQPRACVAACGLVGGVDLPLTVHPFILRGVTLAGIDSAWCPMPLRTKIWERLATSWRIALLDTITRTVKLEEITPLIAEMLGGQLHGRVVVELPND